MTIELVFQNECSVDHGFGHSSRDVLFKRAAQVRLTKKEKECIRWMIHGKSAGEIALILNVSVSTIVTHIENIKQKFQCYKQFQLGYLLGRYAAELLIEEISS